uniref:Major facilitator superfamily (MFS) profile domain-containing protein n=1 Tax=Timema cristinae TaxID=61476 RepID=A0A7R9H2C8_TIMCR|nr:unnamed protein product [Timema cristinae]
MKHMLDMEVPCCSIFETGKATLECGQYPSSRPPIPRSPIRLCLYVHFCTPLVKIKPLERSLGNLVYFTLMLNVNTMSGNPFMNFFWQSLVELFGFILGKYFSEKLGRRWTHILAFMFMFGAHIFIILLVNKPELNWLLLTMVVVVKFFATLSGYTGYLQSMETFPTCVRQTGCALGSSASSIVGTLGPYILYLGSVTDKRYAYAIMGLATLLGAIASFFLPETMNQKLPETLADAAVFGKDQKYWTLYQESNIPFDGTDVSIMDQRSKIEMFQRLRGVRESRKPPKFART